MVLILILVLFILQLLGILNTVNIHKDDIGYPERSALEPGSK